MRAALVACALTLACGHPAAPRAASSPVERLSVLLPPDDVTFGVRLQQACGLASFTDDVPERFWRRVVGQIATCVDERHALLLVEQSDRTVTEARANTARLAASALADALYEHGVVIPIAARVSIAPARPAADARYLELDDHAHSVH